MMGKEARNKQTTAAVEHLPQHSKGASLSYSQAKAGYAAPTYSGAAARHAIKHPNYPHGSNIVYLDNDLYGRSTPNSSSSTYDRHYAESSRLRAPAATSAVTPKSKEKGKYVSTTNQPAPTPPTLVAPPTAAHVTSVKDVNRKKAKAAAEFAVREEYQSAKNKVSGASSNKLSTKEQQEQQGQQKTNNKVTTRPSSALAPAQFGYASNSRRAVATNDDDDNSNSGSVVDVFGQPVQISSSNATTCTALPILGFRMPKDPYKLEIIRPPPQPATDGSEEKKIRYELNPIRVDSEDQFLSLPPEMQQALIRTMQKQEVAFLNPVATQQAKVELRHLKARQVGQLASQQ